MHSRAEARITERIWQISLEQIESTVSEFLGPGRVKRNSRKSTFSRHMSMYLARRVGRWSYPKISRFYNGRHYTTVIAAIGKIERLRKEDESVEALLEMLTSAPSPETAILQTDASKSKWRQLIIDAIAERICTTQTNA
jgi:chromosomal replication initiation ATPase DnaA